MKKQKRQSQRQRQKLSRKTVILLCAVTFSFMVGGLIIFLNVSNVEKTKAVPANFRMVPDQVFTTEKSIAGPVINPQPEAGGNTILVKQAKAIPHTAQAQAK